MMSKQIKIRVYPDGRIESETVGIKGKSCLNYIKEVESGFKVVPCIAKGVLTMQCGIKRAVLFTRWKS